MKAATWKTTWKINVITPDMIESNLKVNNLCLKSTIQPVVFEKFCAPVVKGVQLQDFELI